jgi:hypothetical protein
MPHCSAPFIGRLKPNQEPVLQITFEKCEEILALFV